MAKKLSRRNADRHVLYEKSVQCPEADLDFVERVYKAEHGRRPELVREDFCGTALLSSEWVQRRRRNRSIGVDLDAPTLDWAREHNLARLDDDQRRRVQLVEGDVLRLRSARPEVVVAFNFSYFCFRTRELLGRYLRTVRRSLPDGGMFILDIMGGPDAQTELLERRRKSGFTYVWDQDGFDPIHHFMNCYIHFEFPDGSKMKRAFAYEWRLWGLAEVRELITDAGFSRHDVYWENTDRKTGRGNGVYRKVAQVANEQAWIAMVVAHA